MHQATVPVRGPAHAATSLRWMLAGLGAVSWFAAVCIKDVVRPSIDSPSPGLQLLLGSAPSLLSALALPLFFLAAHPRPTRRELGQVALYAMAVVIVAEGIELFLPGSTFDWRDLLAAVLGIAAATACSWLVLRPSVGD